MFLSESLVSNMYFVNNSLTGWDNVLFSKPSAVAIVYRILGIKPIKVILGVNWDC